MAVQITIKGVPEEVRDELAMRAALQRKSMQEFLRCELERLASKPIRWRVAARRSQPQGSNENTGPTVPHPPRP